MSSIKSCISTRILVSSSRLGLGLGLPNVKLPRQYNIPSRPSTSLAPDNNKTNADETIVNRRKDPLDLSFKNGEAAFRSKTSLEILRAYVVFSLCSSSYLVENNMMLMKIAKRMLGKRLFKSLMKATFYGQFVAGEDQAEIKPVIEKMRTFGVKSILDYSAEEDISSQEATERMTDPPTSETPGFISLGKKKLQNYRK